MLTPVYILTKGNPFNRQMSNCSIINYCKTLYFRCMLISRFSNVEISLHFNLAFSHCSTSIYQTFDGQTEFSQVFNCAILSYSRKFDAHKKLFYSSAFRSKWFLFSQTALLTHVRNISILVSQRSTSTSKLLRELKTWFHFQWSQYICRHLCKTVCLQKFQYVLHHESEISMPYKFLSKLRWMK